MHWARRQSTDETHLSGVGGYFSFTLHSPSQLLLSYVGSGLQGLLRERRAGSRAVLSETGEGSAAAPQRADGTAFAAFAAEVFFI